MTPKIMALVEENHFVMVPVPANLTQHFQPLDLMINGMAMRLQKKKFKMPWQAIRMPLHGNDWLRERLQQKCRSPAS